MSDYLLPVADLVAISVMTLGVYFPRHRRRDLVTAFLAVNVGVLAVTIALSSSTAGVGLGLGLFGVLSIIRLRSAELGQHEVAYYFVALALGLLGGIGASTDTLTIALMAAMVALIAVGDSTLLLGGYRQQVVVLDRAVTDERALVGRLEQLLGARVHRVQVQRVDMVNDSTVVDVRYSVDDQPRLTAEDSHSPASALVAGH